MSTERLQAIEGGKQSDEDRAEDYRARLKPILEEAAKLMNEAKRDGFFTEFNVNCDQFGRYQVSAIAFVKRF